MSLPTLLKYLATVYFCVISFFTSQAQNKVEKVYIHFNKNSYNLGETCWYKAYVVDQELKATSISGVLYVDFLDPMKKVVKHQQLKIYSGEAYGNFLFNQDFSPGNYIVRAYTNFMRNDEPEFFFYKSLFVYRDSLTPSRVSSKKIDLHFFPEGRSIVNKLPTRIAFRAIDEMGRGIDVSANIVDEKNRPVGLLKSTYDGMGVFPYLPTVDKRYRVVLNTGEQFPLPEASDEGVVMNVNNMPRDKIDVRVQSTKNKILRLRGVSHGNTVFNKSFETVKGKSNIEISKDDLPDGICQLTIYNALDVPEAERIVFIQNKKLDVRILSSRLGLRDSVSVSVTTIDRDGKPVPASLSIAIADAAYVKRDSSANISTHMLLQSDLNGYINQPASYLQSPNKYPLDLIMLTSAWRKYDTNKIMLYKAEQQLALRGKVISTATNTPIANADISLMVADIEYNSIHKAVSNASGNFEIDSLDFDDSTTLVWHIKNAKGKPLDARIVLDESVDMPPVDTIFVNRRSQSAALEEINVLNDGQLRDTSRINILDTVEVLRRIKTYKTVGTGNVYVKPDKDDLKLLTTSFLGKYALGLPHLRPVDDGQGQTTWQTPGGGGVSLIVNGYPVLDKGPTGNPLLVLNSYRTDQIEYAIVGGNSRNGYTIILQTKNEVGPTAPGIIKQKAKGYEFIKTFYHPKHGPDNNSATPYRKSTLYWDPFVVTDEKGEAVISFYNSNAANKIFIVVEGMAGDIPVNVSKIIE